MEKPTIEMRRWLELSHAQRGVWLDGRLIGDPAAYQLGALASIAGDVDPDLARQAVRLIMGQHDALRLRVDADEPRQWFEAGAKPPFRLIDLSGDPDRDAALALHIASVRAEGFTLGEQPLFKVDLIRLGPSDWRLLMMCHHLLADGVSIALAQRHWLRAYNTLLGEDEEDDLDGAAPEPAPRSSYAPVIADDEAYAGSARYEEDMAYWRKRLSPLPALVFEDRPRAAAGTGDRPDLLVLEREAFERFEAAARAAGATTHRALIAVLAIALSRRYDKGDFCIGMALHRRDYATRHTIGMLAGMIAVRCRIDPALTLGEAVERLAAEIDADLRHQRTPIDALGRALASGGALGTTRKGLFDVAVTIMPAAREAMPTLGGAPVVSTSLRGPENTPLALYVNEPADKAGLSIQFGFDASVLASAEVQRLRDALAEFVDAFLAQPNRRLSSFDGLTRDERRTIERWSTGAVMPVPHATLPDLFEARAAMDPAAIAVVGDSGQMTYAALDRAADRVAARLLEFGLPARSVVGVALDRSIASVVALVGILKAGCVYLPLDPVYPDDRLGAMIADSDARAVLTDAGVAGRLPVSVPAILFDDAWPAKGAFEPRCDRAGLSPEDRAYVIYTSGSTGRPKGVAVPHRAAVNLAYARQEHDPIGTGDRVLAAISIGFDVSIGQLLLPLLRGATVVVAGDIRGVSGAAFWDFMDRHGVTHVNSVPSFFDSILGDAPARTPLKRVMLGGEPLSGALAARIRTRLGGVDVVNIYGPTEACIDATAYPVPATGMDRVPVLPIGAPLPNYAVHVLDRSLRLSCIGAEGELFIGGAGLAEGYLGMPEVTAERFVETADHGRLYRTGDRALWREDGMLAFLGRTDAQVKIRGFRIEPGEIEAVLLDHPEVLQAAVIARADGQDELRLLAYVTPTGEAPRPHAAALRAFLQRRLPAHMIPAAFTVLDALPLTPNAKLDERALPEPEAIAVSAPGAPPRTATEMRLAEGYATLLGLSVVDVDAHFFELGGHSLLATQLASRLRAELGIELPIRTLFEAPRIVDLAPRIDALIAAAAAGRETLAQDRPALVASPRPERLPLSFAQERLWFLARLDPGSAAYNIPTVLRLDGALDVTALQAALAALVARHESLRTRFAETDGEPQQIVMASRDVPLDIEDLSDGRAREVFCRAEAEARRPFDLERDPLLRVRLLRLGPDAHVFLLTLHHIVSDGWSTGVLVREMAALYQAALAGMPLILPPLPVQYPDYALWQRHLLANGEMARQTAFWQAALAGAPDALTIATDVARPARPAVQSFAGSSHALALPAALAEAVARLARERQATPFIVLLSAWAALLSRWSGQDDIVVGAPIANRTQAETEGLIGFFANTIALRADLSGAPGFGTLVDRMRARALDAYAHQDLPFEKLVDALNPPRDLGRHPLFQTMFVLQNTPGESLEMPGLTLTPIPLPEAAAKFDLTLTLAETSAGLGGAITYASDLFSQPTIARLADQFQRLLEAAVAYPERPLAQIPLLGADERRALLARAGTGTRPVEIDTIPALFERQVARTPDALAVVFGKTWLTYAELNARANRLAHALIARGAGPERPVAVALKRSQSLVVAAMAVMKAGGVYLPLDPTYPAARIAGMLENAAPAVAIAENATLAVLPDAMPILRLDDFDWRAGPQHDPSESDRRSPFDFENLAYIIHTSGSTGRPKGVAVSHAALANLAGARLAHDPIGLGDRVLATVSVGFDVSVGQLVTPLLSGATIVVAGELSAMTGAEFWGLLADEAITHVNSVPAFIDAALDTPPPVLALKRLMLGGEPFSTDLARKLRAALPTTDIVNMYGPTEACIDAACYIVTGMESGASLPIGRALPNYRTHILDGAMEPVGRGIAGEICIGGPSLARGYLGEPSQTAERFVPDPFGLPGERLYRTGDLARWNDDGQMEFLGRLDGQVKIRGFRIELGEIESVLRAHPGVASAAVVTRERHGETVIVAYAVMAPSRPGQDAPSTQALLRYLARSLPPHMIPATVVEVAALATTLNGKLDLKALPEPDFADAPGAFAAPPRDGFDATMRDIWRSVLGHDAVGIDDNFFRVGGHSLMALRIVAACKASFGIDVPLGALFRHQTIRTLADAMRAGSLSATSGPLVQFWGATEGAPLFCIHPVGGSAFGYASLAEALATVRPVVGLQASGLGSGEPLAASLKDMAGDYIRALRTRQPDGPYSLLGHSFGGLVAFEMARQLEADGESVDLIVMLDTSIPHAAASTDDDARLLLQAERAGLGEATTDGDQVRRIEAVIANNIRLGVGYRPTRIEAPILYARAEREDGQDDRAGYWLAATGRPLGHVDVPCNHFKMLRRENLPLIIEAVGLLLR